MGKIGFKASQESLRRKVDETLEKTIIHKRQKELAIGRWDFVVFGPSQKAGGDAVLRIGAAETMVIQNASIYVASIGSPEVIGHEGMMAIEELAGEDISDELRGLEVYHMAPIRPLQVVSKREGMSLDKMRDAVFDEFGDANTAIIETPDEAAWSLSVLKYLGECDEYFPDPLISRIRSRMRDTSISFAPGPDQLLH
ncbi:hypothetical protein MNBD_NITROSPINAE02-2118 [hydrothermal vent metagenome]|uniref:Uncharacterized protein n=1 Tax=hydrothermal vent metagenome TaxID=652676 RepID=A0A3B1C0A8_9ZZZZ